MCRRFQTSSINRISLAMDCCSVSHSAKFLPDNLLSRNSQGALLRVLQSDEYFALIETGFPFSDHQRLCGLAHQARESEVVGDCIISLVKAPFLQIGWIHMLVKCHDK